MVISKLTTKHPNGRLAEVSKWLNCPNYRNISHAKNLQATPTAGNTKKSAIGELDSNSGTKSLFGLMRETEAGVYKRREIAMYGPGEPLHHIDTAMNSTSAIHRVSLYVSVMSKIYEPRIFERIKAKNKATPVWSKSLTLVLQCKQWDAILAKYSDTLWSHNILAKATKKFKQVIQNLTTTNDLQNRQQRGQEGSSSDGRPCQ